MSARPVVVSFGSGHSEVQLFDIGVPVPVETISQRSPMSGYAYVDLEGDLILAPALAGAPLLLYRHAYTNSPIRIKQPHGSAALAMIQPRGGPLFVALGGLQNAALSIIDLATLKTVGRIDLPMTPTALASDRSANVLMAMCCRNKQSILLLLRPPYLDAIPWSSIPGNVLSIYRDSSGVTFLAVAGEHNSSRLFYRRPGANEAFRSLPVRFRSDNPIMVGKKDGVYVVDGRDLFSVGAPYTALSVHKTSLGLDTRTRAIDMITLGDSLVLLLARGATLGRGDRQQFALWQYDCVSDRLVWSSGMLDDPGPFPGEPPSSMVAGW